MRKEINRLNIKLKNPLYRLSASKEKLQTMMQVYTQCQTEIKNITAKHSLENFSQSSLHQICDLVDMLEAIFGFNNPLGSSSQVLFSIDPHKLEHQMIYKVVQDFFQSRHQ